MEFSNWKTTAQIPALRDNQIQLFKIDLSNAKNLVDANVTIPFLTSNEIDRLNKYRFSKDKLSFSICRYAIRMLSSHLLNIDSNKIALDLNEYGKPYIRNEKRIKFNISHSGDLLLLGFVLDNELGVDTEKYNYQINHLDLSESVFSFSERQTLLKLQDDKKITDGFYNCWTKKESFIKAKGKGLQIPLDQFSVRVFDEENKNNLESINWDQSELTLWKNCNFGIKEDYAAAVCCHSNIDFIDRLDISQFILGGLE